MRKLLVVALVLGGCLSPAGLRGGTPDEVRTYVGDVDSLAQCLLTGYEAGSVYQTFRSAGRAVPGQMAELTVDSDFFNLAHPQTIATLEIHRAADGRVRVELRARHGLFGTSVDEENVWTAVAACAGAPVSE